MASLGGYGSPYFGAPYSTVSPRLRVFRGGQEIQGAKLGPGLKMYGGAYLPQEGEPELDFRQYVKKYLGTGRPSTGVSPSIGGSYLAPQTPTATAPPPVSSRTQQLLAGVETAPQSSISPPPPPPAPQAPAVNPYEPQLRQITERITNYEPMPEVTEFVKRRLGAPPVPEASKAALEAAYEVQRQKMLDDVMSNAGMSGLASGGMSGPIAEMIGKGLGELGAGKLAALAEIEKFGLGQQMEAARLGGQLSQQDIERLRAAGQLGVDIGRLGGEMGELALRRQLGLGELGLRERQLGEEAARWREQLAHERETEAMRDLLARAELAARMYGLEEGVARDWSQLAEQQAANRAQQALESQRLKKSLGQGPTSVSDLASAYSILTRDMNWFDRPTFDEFARRYGGWGAAPQGTNRYGMWTY